MSELKFRAWNIDCHKFEYFEIGENDDCYGMFRVTANKFGSVVEQYTGLKDKNGKEIYEGDIVNVIGIGIAQVIDSPSGEWMLYYKREPDEIKNGFACVIPKNKPSGLWKTNTTSYIEVIGNIHENPELLEDKKCGN